MKRFHGKVRVEERAGRKGGKPRPCWVVECEPLVALKLKRTFPRANPDAVGNLIIASNMEADRDLEWFLERWPMELTREAAAALKRGAGEHRKMEEEVANLLAGGPLPAELFGPAGSILQQASMDLSALKPREYQQVAAYMLWTVKRMMLADDLGLGKTASSLTALNNPACRPALIVSPTHLVKQWIIQAGRFVPHLTIRELKTGSPLGERPDRIRGRQVPWPDILITTYGKVAGWAEFLAPHLRTVVAEEAQELRGDPEGRRNKAMAFLYEAVTYTLGLTATPIYNYGGEVYRVLNTLAPGRLGTEEEFAREWCGTRSVDKAKVKNPQLLGQHLRDMGLMLRRTRAEVGRELPKQQWIQVPVESDTKVIQQAEGAAAELARIILAQSGYNGMAKLKAAQELDAKIRHATGVAKAPFVAGFVRQLVQSREDGKPESVILTGWHRDVYAIWLEQLQDLKPALYSGSESPTEKAEALRRFTSGETPVLILSNRSGAGIDGLQYVCRNIVVGEMDWAHGVHEQIGGRVDRDGQTQPTSVYFPVADAGSDPVMAEVNGVKAAQLQGINNPDKEVVEPLEPDEDRMKLLAESLLARHRAAA